MKKLAMLAALAMVAGQASAATMTYNAIVNLNDPDYTIINVDGVQLFLPGIYSPGANPFTLKAGDTLVGSVSFNGNRLQIIDRGALEIITFYPFISTDLSNTVSNGTLTFLDVKGDYVGPTTITGNISGAVLGGFRIGDLTPTSFSFSGIQFTLNYQSGTATTFDPYVVAHFSRVNAAVIPAAVPEPASWALLLLGFGAIGSAMRRQRGRCGAIAAHTSSDSQGDILRASSSTGDALNQNTIAELRA